ncbi:MAG: CCA-adding enzyme [Chlamydiae bacterium]|nr:CCA-adding enzyme [Chlamydiota bacterium]
MKLAKQICERLFEAGYTAYFAGGWVRDRLLGRESDEIDIATSAPPEVIQDLFPKTLAVGAQFGVIVVVLERHSFEVTTFRKDHPYFDGRHPEGVDYSTPEKDAERRDFTINGMFFDPLTESFYDYVEGKEDLKKGIIRAIGDPEKRFAEDRLRMIRAVRFAARFDFTIEKETENAIERHASTLLPAVSVERIWQEWGKMSAYSHFNKAIRTLHRLGLLPTIFPSLKEVTVEEIENRTRAFPYFPLETPPIVYLLELFPDHSLENILSLCDFLKTSGEEKKLATFFKQGEKLIEHTPERHLVAHFYAHKEVDLFLNIQGAKRQPPERSLFLEEHMEQKKMLRKAIERIQKGTPLLTSSHLKEAGITPGPLMGKLLKEAEKIAIEHNLNDPQILLETLKKSPLWPS